MFSDDDLLTATLGYVEFCLDKARDCETKEDVNLWKERATGAFDVWQILHPENAPAEDQRRFRQLLGEFEALPEG